MRSEDLVRFSTYFLIAALAAAVPQPAARTALRFGHAWDGTRVLHDVLITVEGDKVVSVEAGRTDMPAGAVDLRRYTAIPGLVDLHTHITYYWDRKPGTRPLGQRRRRPAVTVFLAQENARRTLDT